MTKELFLIWEIPNNNKWLPIAKLLYDAKKYIFKYTIGAEWARNKENFIAFPQMTDFNKIYESEYLFPLFKNRLLPKSRPEYQKYLNWLDLDENNYSYFEELSRTGGTKATDSFRILQIPENKNGKYEVSFFINGIRYLTSNSIDRIDRLEKNRSLYLMRDIQKKFKVILKPTGEDGRYTKLQESEIIIALSEVKLENDKYIYDKNVLSLKDKDDSEYDKIEIETNTPSDKANKDEEANVNNTVMIYIDKRDIGGVEFTEEEKSKLSLTSEIILNAVSNKRIEYNNVKKPVISAKEKLREANFSKVSTPVAFPISGFKADVQGFTGGELADIMLSVATTSADLFNKKVSIMYRKIKPLNRKPFESFDDFISNFSYITDLDIAVWAALVSNSLEKETMVITCADCGKKYKQTYVPRELPMFESVDKTVLNELEKVSTMVDTDDYDSIISRSKIVSFEDSGVDVMFGIASLKEYMISNPVIIDVLERVQKEHSGYELTELEIMLFSLFIRGVRFKSAFK